METPSPSFKSYLKHASAVDRKHLIRSDERTWFSQVREGGPGTAEARQKLIEAHTRLGVSIARHYQGAGLDLEDLTGVANVGLIKAIDKINAVNGRGFDPTKGTWITYVMTTIDRTIERAIAETTRTVRVPVNVHEALWKMERSRAALETKLGRSPDPDELASELNISPAKLETLRLASGPTVSLDARLEDGDDRCLLDLIPDERQSPEATLIEAEEGDMVAALLDTLTQREKEIVSLRFGITSGEEKTFAEIAAEIGVSKERVRQIVTAALIKMREAVGETEIGQLLNN